MDSLKLHDKIISELTTNLDSNNMLRKFRVFDRESISLPYANLIDGDNTKKVTIWCSNDYLGMSKNEFVKTAAIHSIKSNGVGSGSVRSLTGTTTQHIELEKRISQWYKKESTLLYNSAFVGNESAIASFASAFSNCIIYSDELNHNSIIQGIKQSKAKKYIFKHNSPSHLRSLLKNSEKEIFKIIICESIYSMNGDIAPLDDYCQLSKEFGAYLYVDEVHAVGLYGESGSGYVEKLGLLDDVDVIEGTLGKAVGVIGGFVAGSEIFVNWVKQKSPGFIFSTSLPPSMAEAARSSIDYIQKNKSLRNELFNNVSKTIKKIKKSGIPLLSEATHILPVHVGSAEIAQAIAEDLLNNFDISVQAIIYPSVKIGNERLRITPSPYHSDEHIDTLCESLQYLFEKYNLNASKV